MKVKNLLLIAAVAVFFASCANERYTAEGLVIPIVHAIQDHDAGELECLIPDEKKINDVYGPNSAALGGQYYNKYTASYRKQNLIANLTTDMQIIENVSETNNIDWKSASLGAVEKTEVIDSAQNFTWVTANLRFSSGDYQLRYRTAQYNGLWYLLGDIDFARQLPY